MKLSEKQRIFSLNLSRLVLWIDTLPGYMARYDEVGRSQFTQDHYVKIGASKSKEGMHVQRLAGDILINYKGKWLEGRTQKEREYFRIIGEKWEEWGGEWGGRFGVAVKDYNKKVGWDSGHFQWSKKMVGY